MIKVSVIIPVYNVENYLRECLDSVINQTLKDIEIICIDDSSTDNSYTILEEYVKKDKRLKIFRNSQNESVGYNRNFGMKEAKGEYISFIDSDDFISKDFLYNLYNTAKKYDSDIVNTLNMYKYTISCKKNKLHCNNFGTKKEYASEFNLLNIDEDLSKNNIVTYSVNKLYKRLFLINNNIYFLPTKFGASEDADFTIRVMLNKPTISFNNRAAYYYRERESSLTALVSKNKECSINAIYNLTNTLNYCKNNHLEYLNIISAKLWNPVFNFYNSSSLMDKMEIYDKLYNFAKELHIDEKYINKKNDEDYFRYMNYLTIKCSKTYDLYLMYSSMFVKLLDISKNVEINNNRFRLFYISNTNKYLIIIILGIKIVIKKFYN